MPSNKKGSITLTFSKRNGDVDKLFSDKRETDPTFVATEYICNAVRFFEKYKDSALESKESLEASMKVSMQDYIDKRLRDLQLLTTIDNEVSVETISEYTDVLEKEILNKSMLNED